MQTARSASNSPVRDECSGRQTGLISVRPLELYHLIADLAEPFPQQRTTVRNDEMRDEDMSDLKFLGV